MIFLDVAKPFKASVKPEILKRAAETTLAQVLGAEPASLTLVITGEDHIRQLNAKFLGFDEPTDVLSFPADYFGDVVISHPQACAQARAGEHSLEAELQLLAVHGVLHLLGYDHAELDEKQAMWEVQSLILGQLGSAVSSPPG
jgi:probable rRNA maturation factor